MVTTNTKDLRQNNSPSTPIVLSIAGSDSSAGAGIQADIKAISATGSYAATVITAITAQNTQGVTDIHAVPLESVAAQLDAVLSDLSVSAVKIGMLSDTAVIKLIAEKLREYQCQNIVLDPVMVATSGDILLAEESIQALKEHLIPLASVITPNLPEASALLGLAYDDIVVSQAEMQVLAERLSELGEKAVLLKGGHLATSESSDLLYNCATNDAYWMVSERIDTKNTHGTGCTLSSAMASYLAQGESLKDAAQKAKDYIHQAILHADELNIGKGSGPVNHFFKKS